MANVLDKLRSLADPEVGHTPPTEADFIQFLNDNVSNDYIVLYASVQHLFLHGVLVPDTVATERDIDDLLNWHGNPSDSWSISAGNRIVPPLSTFGSRGIAAGEQIVFLRSFSGLSEDQRYLEIWQKLLHTLGLHHMRERKAWCRIDRHGDIEEVIKVLEKPAECTELGSFAVVAKRECLAEYALMTNSVLLFMFDFIPTAALAIDFFGPENIITEFPVRNADSNIYYRYREENGNLIWIGGIQLRSVHVTHSEDFWTHKKYEAFLALDWTNGEVREISCSPASLSNYYTKSPSPFEMSPAFFRPEVLSKYKADREKYTLKERSISCRGVWHLQTYDINAAGQVHTYLAYLRQLPNEEQLYWKSFNEHPKAPISERSFKTDFLGELSYSESNPLASLKETLHGLRVPWWRLRAEDEIQWAHYPVTGSNDEWRHEIQRLDRLVVEGFEERWLREQARKVGALPDEGDKSIALLEKCLIANGIEESAAKVVVRPFREIRAHRSTFAHTAGQEARRLKERAFENHGGYRQHYTHLAGSCCESMRRIAQEFGKATER